MSDPLMCPGCHRRYRWKQPYAGKKVQCACGQLMVMPAVDPDAALPPLETDHDTPAAPPAPAASPPPAIKPLGQGVTSSPPAFELAEEPAPARPRKVNRGLVPSSHTLEKSDLAGDNPSHEASPLEVAVMVEEAPPAATPSAAYLEAMSARPSAVAQALLNREDEFQPSPIKEKYFPAALATTGVIAQVALWFVFASTPARASLGAVGMLLVEALILAPIAVLAVATVAKMMNIALGPLVPALVRIVAIAIGAGGVADILFFKIMLSVEFDYQILLVGFVLHMILIGIPVAIIFDMDMGEMAAIVAIIVVPRIAILYGLGVTMPHLF